MQAIERNKISQNQKPDTASFFNHLWQIWKLLGVMMNIEEHRRLYFIFYSAVVNICVTICYPLHVSLMLFQSDNMSDNIKNLAVSVTCVACSVKFILNTTKIKQIHEFDNLLNQLDARIQEGPELIYFGQLQRLLRNISLVFLGLYSSIGISAGISFLFSPELRLVYPACFPFDWHGNTFNFYMANIYQVGGICVLLMENYVNDTFPPMALCVLSGHIEILSIRVANVGHSSKTKKENEEDMVKCVLDQKLLYELFSTIENIVSSSMMIQFAVTAFSICVAMVALLFYVDNPPDFFYYITYFLAMPLEIFPACYYGSDIQYRFGELHRSVFRSNWVEQSPKFKKDMIIFVERSLKESVAMAGGMVRIHLNTFFSTCKGAYSLFAVIMRLK